MKITKEDAEIKAQESIAEAYHQFDKGDLGNTMIALTVARAYVDMLQRMKAGAANMRAESIEFGDGKAPFEVALEKGENSK